MPVADTATRERLADLMREDPELRYRVIGDACVSVATVYNVIRGASVSASTISRIKRALAATRTSRERARPKHLTTSTSTTSRRRGSRTG